MEDILQKIVAAKRRRIPSVVDPGLDYRPRTGFFTAAMRAEGLSFICEYKKASPSQGDIRLDLEPEDVAQAYAAGGARALSVLTEEDFFKGELAFIGRVRETVDLPILRKDFIFEDIQVEETARCGADAVLLIVAVLGERLGHFAEQARRHGLDMLVEVHNRGELETALAIEVPVIGINNRDLATFDVTLDTTVELIREIPRDRIVVSESGIHGPRDIARVRACGAGGVLVGEALMRSSDIQGQLEELQSGRKS